MEKKKAPISLTGLIVLIIFLAAVVGGLVYFFINYDLTIMSKNKPQEIVETEKEEVSKVEELDKDSELVKELYSIVLKYDKFERDNREYDDRAINSFYRDEKITYSKLLDSEKVLSIINATRNQDYTKHVELIDIGLKEYNKMYEVWKDEWNRDSTYKIATGSKYSNISQTLKRIFGEKAKIENKNYGLLAGNLEYYNDAYYIYDVYGGGMGNPKYAYSEIQKVEKIDDRIEIYDKYIYLDFLKAWLPEDDELVYIYTSADKTKEIGKEEDKFVFWDNVNKKEYSDEEIFGSVYKKYENKLNTYKHTFQKSGDGSYYWVSSEIYEVSEKEENLSNENLEKMAKELLEKYMKLDKYEDYAVGPMANILIDLGFEDELEFGKWLLDQPFKSLRETIKTNVKYDEFKKALLEYMTENYFIERFSHYTNMDGYVGISKAAMSTPLMQIEKVTLNLKENNKYTFDVVLKDVELYEHYLDPQEGETITEEECFSNNKIIFEFANDKLFIDKWE